MQITRVETIPVRVPIRKEFQIRGSLGMHTESPFLILRLHTDEDLMGLGEVSCTPVWSGEDQVTAAHIIDGKAVAAALRTKPMLNLTLTSGMPASSSSTCSQARFDIATPTAVTSWSREIPCSSMRPDAMGRKN